MSTDLNLYATKVFAEHPISLWSLDDTSDYVNIINDTNQNLNNWTIEGATVVDARTDVEFASDKPNAEPFREKYLNGVIEILNSGGIFSFESPNFIQPSDIDVSLGSFSMAVNLFTYDRTTSVRIGYSYFSGSERVEVIRETVIPPERQWASVSQTFTLPNSFSDLKFIIEIYFTESESEYKIAINGINIGQSSEEFHLESAGVVPTDISNILNISALGVEAFPYGLDGASGYYLSDGKTMYAQNTSLPIVYGSSNSTVIRPFEENPSIIVPGFGFLNQSGQYQKLTFEFWAKIKNQSFESRKFFGPVFSSDGLYVEGPFIILKVNNFIGSHYVGEWDRPMLFNIRYSPTKCSLVLNGEEVISLDLDDTRIVFPDKEDINGLDQDWVGFYAYDDVPLSHIDCVGVYPYEVPSIVCKRRFVFGQAVDIPTNLQGFKTNNSLYVDSSFSKNAKNYSYPLLGRWENAIVENLVPDPLNISSPSYNLPKIVFNNKTEQEWYNDVTNSQVSGYSFFSLEPNEEWSETEGYLYLDSLDNILEETKAIYGVFSLKRLYETKQVLIDMVNSITGDSLEISVVSDTINYVLKTKQSNGSFLEENIFSATGLVSDAIFLAGVHIPRAREAFGYKLSRFFTNKRNIKVFISGSEKLENTFRGRIHSFGVSSKRNLLKIEDEFLLIGMPINFSENYAEILIYDGGEHDTTEWEYEYESGRFDQEESEVDVIANASGSSAALLVATDAYLHIATYTVIPKDYFGAFVLDVGADSYWEDYLPLSYFSKYVSDGSNTKYRELDFIQFNADYPFFNKYRNGFYDSSNSPVRMYATFEYLINGVAKPISSFLRTQKLPESGVVRPGIDWQTTRYEIVDDTIIYPPIFEDFNNIAIKISFEIVSDGVINKPISIKSLQLSSTSLGFFENKIGNRFGADLSLYRQVGNSIDYKNVSPYSIYKNSVPYLYLSGSSGIRIRDNYLTSDNRGLAMKINKGRGKFFKVGSLQILTKYEKREFPNTPVKIFEIDARGRSVNFYLVAFKGNPNRGYVYALNGETGRPETDIVYSLDGRIVKRPVLNSNMWTAIGIGFESPLDFSETVGEFRVTNPIFISNVSYYQVTERREAARLAYRKWYAVRSEPDNELDWDYWDESTWQEVLFLREATPEVTDPTIIYKKYTGTDRIINQSNSNVLLGDYKYSFFKDIKWSRITLNSA